MHTLNYGGTTFHYNGDFSGYVTITRHDGSSIKLLADDLIGFVAEYVRREKIAKLESMSADEILNLKETTRS